MAIPFNRALDQNPARLSIVLNRQRNQKKAIRQSMAGFQLLVFGVVACCSYIVQ